MPAALIKGPMGQVLTENGPAQFAADWAMGPASHLICQTLQIGHMCKGAAVDTAIAHPVSNGLSADVSLLRPPDPPC
jgi:hypothetical protein